MTLRVWIWRLSLILIAVFLMFGMARLSFEALRNLFSAQILGDESFSYPEFQVAFQALSETENLWSITLEPYSPLAQSPAHPEELFLSIHSSHDRFESSSSQRISGYPFLQAFLRSDEFPVVELLHQMGIERKIIKSQRLDPPAQLNASSLKGAAQTSQIQQSSKPVQILWWHYPAVVLLMVLGSLYMYLRYASLRASLPEKK